MFDKTKELKIKIEATCPFCGCVIKGESIGEKVKEHLEKMHQDEMRDKLNSVASRYLKKDRL